MDNQNLFQVGQQRKISIEEYFTLSSVQLDSVFQKKTIGNYQIIREGEYFISKRNEKYDTYIIYPEDGFIHRDFRTNKDGYNVSEVSLSEISKQILSLDAEGCLGLYYLYPDAEWTKKQLEKIEEFINMWGLPGNTDYEIIENEEGDRVERQLITGVIEDLIIISGIIYGMTGVTEKVERIQGYWKGWFRQNLGIDEGMDDNAKKLIKRMISERFPEKCEEVMINGKPKNVRVSKFTGENNDRIFTLINSAKVNEIKGAKESLVTKGCIKSKIKKLWKRAEIIKDNEQHAFNLRNKDFLEDDKDTKRIEAYEYQEYINRTVHNPINDLIKGVDINIKFTLNNFATLQITPNNFAQGMGLMYYCALNNKRVIKACIFCKKIFNPKRKDNKYCSDYCRKNCNREKRKKEEGKSKQ